MKYFIKADSDEISQYGGMSALFLGRLRYWIEKNRHLPSMQVDGLTWAYAGYDRLAIELGCTVGCVRKIVANLIRLKAIDRRMMSSQKGLVYHYAILSPVHSDHGCATGAGVLRVQAESQSACTGNTQERISNSIKKESTHTHSLTLVVGGRNPQGNFSHFSQTGMKAHSAAAEPNCSHTVLEDKTKILAAVHEVTTEASQEPSALPAWEEDQQAILAGAAPRAAGALALASPGPVGSSDDIARRHAATRASAAPKPQPAANTRSPSQRGGGQTGKAGRGAPKSSKGPSVYAPTTEYAAWTSAMDQKGWPTAKAMTQSSRDGMEKLLMLAGTSEAAIKYLVTMTEQWDDVRKQFSINQDQPTLHLLLSNWFDTLFPYSQRKPTVAVMRDSGDALEKAKAVLARKLAAAKASEKVKP